MQLVQKIVANKGGGEMSATAIVKRLPLTRAEKNFLIDLLETEVERYNKEKDYCAEHDHSNDEIEMWADGIKNAESILAELK